MSSVKDKWLRIGNVEIKATRCQYDIDLGLSDREIEVLLHLGAGRTVIETAKRIGVTTNTVGTFKARIFSKLQVNTTVEAVVIATAIITGAEVITGELRHKART